MIKDAQNNIIGIGNRFEYQANVGLIIVGTLIDVDGSPHIKWNDRTGTIPLGDFWYGGTDKSRTKKLFD